MTSKRNNFENSKDNIKFTNHIDNVYSTVIKINNIIKDNDKLEIDIEDLKFKLNLAEEEEENINEDEISYLKMGIINNRDRIRINLYDIENFSSLIKIKIGNAIDNFEYFYKYYKGNILNIDYTN